MTTAHLAPSTTAVLLHEVKPIQGTLFGFITHSYGQENSETTIHRLTSMDDLDMLMVDRFLAVWGEVKDFDGSVNFYTTSPILRSLLKEQRVFYPQICVCTLVVGETLRRQWDAAKASCRSAREDLLTVKMNKEKTRLNTRPPHHVVVGTDASKSSGRNTGWAFATSDGRLRSGVIEAADIGRGEFHAVTCAVERYQYTSCKVLDILTDSWEVYKTVNCPEERSQERIKQHAVRCLSSISAARRHGVDVRVHWVRGHNGNVLNEFADRAAVSARRCADWELGSTHLKKIESRIRHELREETGQLLIEKLLPRFGDKDAVEAAAA